MLIYSRNAKTALEIWICRRTFDFMCGVSKKAACYATEYSIHTSLTPLSFLEFRQRRSKVFNQLPNMPFDIQTNVPSSNPAATPGAGPSKSTSSTLDFPSLDSRTKFPKYFLATSLSLFTLTLSSLFSPSCWTDCCRPARRLSAGYRRILRTSVEMRAELVWV